jgi:hypothetical protein
VFDWYWALEGWQWVVATVGMLGGAIAAFFGMIILAGTSITKIDQHEKRCECTDCQRKRQLEWARKKREETANQAPNEPRIINPRAIPMVSTNNLKVGMLVLARRGADVYKVNDLQWRDYGRLVFLINQRNQKPAMVRVVNSQLSNRIWIISSRNND